MDIQGYPEYTISSDGRVFSKKRKIFLKQSEHGDGYLQVTLYKKGVKKPHKIHRLVGIHFIPNPDNLECIDHINKVRPDNFVENLRWVTHRQNSNNRTDQSIYGCNIMKRKDRNLFVFQFVLHGKNHIKSFKNIEECQKYKEKFIAEKLVL